MFTHAGAINWFVVNDAIKNLRYLPKRFCNHDIKINLKMIVEQLKKPTVYILRFQLYLQVMVCQIHNTSYRTQLMINFGDD